VRDGDLTVRSLLTILCQGITDDDTQSGYSPYAMFLRSLMQSGQMHDAWPDVEAVTPWTYQVVRKLRELLPHLSEQVFHLRLYYATLMFIDAMRDPRTTRNPVSADEQSWAVAVAIDMAVGGLCAPA